MNHLLLSFHTCPLEEPGVGLAGGMNVVLRELLRGLSREGIRTDVLTRGLGDRPETTRPWEGTRIVHLPCGWTTPPTRALAWRSLPAFLRAASGFLAAGPLRYGAVSAHYWMSGAAAAGLPTSGKVPLVLMYHTVEARKVRPPGTLPDPLSPVRRDQEERLAERARRIVFPTEEDLRETARAIPPAAGKGVVIPPGVGDPFRNPPPREEGRSAFGIPAGAFAFLLAARPDPEKNVETALAAFRRLRAAEGERAVLVVAGREPPGGDRTEGVRWPGPVPHARMPLLYAACDAVLCPSRYESFGMVQLEAMAARVPILVPSDGFWGRVVSGEGGGIGCGEAGEEELLAGMRALLKDPALRSRLGEEAGRVATRFTWERCTQRWASLLSSLATPGSRRGTPRAPGAPRRRGAGRPGAS